MTEAWSPRPRPAGSLIFRSTAPPGFEKTCLLYPNDEFDIGRQLVHSLLGLEDRSVSSHHLRVRCVVYEDDVRDEVAPMIYIRVLSTKPVLLTRYGNGDDPPCDRVSLNRASCDVLLNPGDSLQLTRRIVIDFRTIRGVKFNPPPLDTVRRTEISLFRDRYQISGRVLGVGGYAAVYVATKSGSSQQFACKIVALSRKRTDRPRAGIPGKQNIADQQLQKKRDAAAREYSVLQLLSHPNIISLEKVFCTPCNIYIFQELITGGDLLSYLDKQDMLPEPQAAMIVRQLLEAVKYLHENQVVHRDIKPENILMTSWRDGARIVLTDFGQSRTTADAQRAATKEAVFRMQSVVGTYGYTAPEVYHPRSRAVLADGAGYSQAIDIWSVGCVTATLLTNDFIFPDGKDLRIGGVTSLSQFARHLDILDRGPDWQHVSPRAKDFVRGCLAIDDVHRLTAAQCLRLPWFQHPDYRADFDAAYERATREWKGKEYDDTIVEDLDTDGAMLSDGLVPSPSEAASRPRSASPASNAVASLHLHASPAEVPVSSSSSAARP